MIMRTEFDSSKGYPVIETPFLSREVLWKYRNKANRDTYLRPSVIIKHLIKIKSPRDLWQLSKEGFALIRTIKN